MTAPLKRRPNVILILADDMGFSDLGCTGSEIRTPRLDGLARDGALATAMYNCARCCPTRAALLTGLYPHAAGIGHMGTDLGTPAYSGQLAPDAATVAEALRADGYFTGMSGKWHVAGDDANALVKAGRAGDPGFPTPCQRGFDRFWGFLEGATHFFSPYHLMQDDRALPDRQDNFYITDAITDQAITMMDEAAAAKKPFFLYIAHPAPHWPLHAPPEDIARYDGVYAKGWDATRTARHEDLNGRGILQANWNISPRDPDVAAWEDQKGHDWEAAKMATYAAMVDRMDANIGRMIAALKERGEYDDTLILFLSDNGGCAEFMAEDGWARFYPDRTHDGRKIRLGNVEGLHPGDATTFQSYDRPWANVSNAPFRLFKHYVHEGGISTPLIAHWPGRVLPGTVVHQPMHVIDILPTILAATGARQLSEIRDRPARRPEGENLLDALAGRPWARDAPIFFEHEGNAAVRSGKWKLVHRHDRPWELYDMEADRTELHDLAGRHAVREADLQAQWRAWAGEQGAADWDRLVPRLLRAWGLASVDG